MLIAITHIAKEHGQEIHPSRPNTCNKPYECKKESCENSNIIKLYTEF